MKNPLQQPFNWKQYLYAVPLLFLSSYMIVVLYLTLTDAIQFNYNFLDKTEGLRRAVWVFSVPVFVCLLACFELCRRQNLNLYPMAVYPGIGAFLVTAFYAAEEPAPYLAVIPALGALGCCLVLPVLRRWRVHLRIERRLRKWERPIPYVLWVLVFAWMFIFSYHRYASFSANSRDLGIFTQSIWLLSRGLRPANTVMGMHAFGDHADLISFFVVPIMWVWESPGALLLFQSSVVSIGVVGMFKFARRKTRSAYAALIATLLFPLLFAVQSAAMFDYNPETVAIGFVPWLFYFADSGKWKRAALMLFLIAICKENLLLFTTMFGVFTIVYYKRPWKGLAILGLSLAAFWAEITYFFPHFREGGFRHLEHKGASLLGEGFLGVIKRIVTSPVTAVVYVLTGHEKALCMIHLFGTLMFLSLLFPYTILITGSFLATRFLGKLFPAWIGGYFYGGVHETVLLICVVMLVPHAARKVRKLRLASAAFYVPTTAAVSLVLFLAFAPLQDAALLHYTTGHYPRPELQAIHKKAIKLIPRDAPVIAQDNLVPHLSMRRRIYRPEEQLIGWADYVVIDKKGRLIPPVTIDRFAAFQKTMFASPEFEIIFHEKSVTVFARKDRVPADEEAAWRAAQALAPGDRYSGLLGLSAADARARAVKIDGTRFLPAGKTSAKSYDAVVDFAPPHAAAMEFSVLFAFGPEGGYEATFGRSGCRLSKVARGKRTVLARSASMRVPSMLKRLTLRRLDDLIVVIADGAVVCRALDTTFTGGSVLVPVGMKTPKAEKVGFRARRPVFFSDDFMVTPEEEAADRGWRPVKGRWRFKSIRPDNAPKDEAYHTRSANPFVYLGAPAAESPLALTATGEAWWSGYSLRAAVKCLGQGAAGVAFGVESPAEFWLVKLECSTRFEAPSRLQLIRMSRGRPRLISEKLVPARHGQWYDLAVEVDSGRVRVMFLGSPVMDVADRRITGGRVGLVAEGLNGAVFDDVEVRELRRIRFDRVQDLALGREATGRWRRPEIEKGLTVVMRPRPEQKECVYVVGSPEWEGGAVAADLRPGSWGSSGLIAGVNGDRFYRLALKPSGKGAVLAVAGGHETTLRTFRHGVKRGDWCKVRLDLAEKGVISAYVDGELVARVKTPDAPKGRIAFFTDAAFDAAVRNLVADRSPQLSTSRSIGNRLFSRDPHMSAWASERGQWVPNDGVDKARGRTGYVFTGKDVFWRKGDYYGDTVIYLPLTIEHSRRTSAGAAPHSPIRGALAVHFGLKSRDLGGGYAVAAKAGRHAEYDVALTHRGKRIAAAVVHTDAIRHGIRIFNTRRHIWAAFGTRRLFSHVKTAPDDGTRIAIVRKGTIDFKRLAVHTTHLDDSSFERAPTRWRLAGDWRVSPRYDCDPKWSWMGAESPLDHAAMWRRSAFPGDVTVELYASMKMRPGGLPYCPGDLNLTISADADSPARGYTFIVGGWRNSRTALLRNGKVVASTTKRYLPDTRDGLPEPGQLHLRWFYVKARRKGPKIELYLDNELTLQYTDPEPLAGGKVGVWTQEQNLSVARVQIYHANAAVSRPAAAAPKSREPKPSPKPLKLTCKGRTGFLFDFESAAQGWCEGGGATALAVRDAEAVGPNGGRACLRLVNADRPGRFAADIPITVPDLLACPALSFDYKIPPDVKINLYFDVPRMGRVGACTYFIALTGPDDSTPAVRLAGRFPDVKADNAWHTARIDIAKAMRRFYPAAPALQAGNFRLALERPSTYAASGIGGNPIGAVYHVDNFLLASAVFGNALIRWEPPATTPAGYAFCLTNRPVSEPGHRVNLSTPYVVIKTGKPGVIYLHVRPVAKEGEPKVPAAHFPLCGLGPAVEVAKITPADGSKWGGEPIRVHLSDSSALAVPSLVGSVNGAGAFVHNRALSVDWQRGILTIDPSRLPVRFNDGDAVNCLLKLQAAGQKPVDAAWRYTASLARDKTPPGEVVLQGHEQTDDFETPGHGWITGPSVAAAVDTNTAASGKGSLEILSTGDGGFFNAYRARSGRMGARPVIEFDYKAGPSVRTDLIMRSQAGRFTVTFLDRSGERPIGRIPGVTADGAWRRASVDVFDMLWRTRPLALSSRLRSIGFGDYGWPSSRSGDRFHIDNFRAVPLLSSRGGSELRATAADALGVAGYAFKWSARPDDDPPGQAAAPDGVIRVGALPEGRQILHIRAVDRAGNLGPVSHYPFIIDNTPPKVAAISPRPGEAISPHRFAVAITDAFGPDPEKLKLTIGGKTYTMRSAALESAGRPTLVWNLARAAEDTTAFADGRKIEFTLSGVEDFAGNRAPRVTGHWTMDHKQDKQPPQRVEIDLRSAEVAFVKRFDRGLDGAAKDQYAAVTAEPAAEVPSRVITVRQMEDLPGGVVIAHKPFDLAKTGLIKLDVDLAAAPVFVDLLLTGKTFKCKVRMGDPPPPKERPKVGAAGRDGFVYLGAMKGIRSAAGWHTQWADLHTLVKKALPGLKSPVIESVRVGRYCQPYSDPQPVRLDNIMVYGRGRNKLEAVLRSRDATGIAGFAVDVAADPALPLAKKINHRTDTLSRTLTAGTWYVRVLACDNNGNWSRVPGVLPYVVSAP